MVCPVCGRDRLAVNMEKQVWHCWICQEYKRNNIGRKVPVKGAGNLVSLVALLEGWKYGEARSFVKDNISVNIKALNPNTKKEGITEIQYPPYAKKITGILPYCEQRGITLEDVQAFGLFFCDNGKYRNRLIFPVYEQNKLVFYQGRAMWDPQPGEVFIKSLNPPKLDGMVGAEATVFNLEQAARWPRVVITEGPIDAIHVGPQAICTWGKHITEQQMLKIYHAGVRSLTLMWDGPTEVEPSGAVPEILQAVPRLSGMFDVRVVFLPEGDPADYSRAELNRFQAQSIRSSKVSSLGIL